MADDFSKFAVGLDSPGVHGFTITPHDTDELTHTPRGVYVGGDGNLVVVLSGDTDAVTFASVPAGTLLPIRPKIVKDTDTTATSIVGVY